MRGDKLSWACILWDRDFVNDMPRYRAVYGRAGVAPGSSAFDAEAEALRQAVQLFMELITGKICDGWRGWQADGVKCLEATFQGVSRDLAYYVSQCSEVFPHSFKFGKCPSGEMT